MRCGFPSTSANASDQSSNQSEPLPMRQDTALGAQMAWHVVPSVSMATQTDRRFEILPPAPKERSFRFVGAALDREVQCSVCVIETIESGQDVRSSGVEIHG